MSEGRKYLGWENSADVEWRVKKERDGRKIWTSKWGGFMDLHGKWVCSDIRRAMRKPSFTSLEWLAYQRKFEVGPVGEWNTRYKGVEIEPPNPNCCCKPTRWPCTTYGEIGWLAKDKNCHLEVYDMKYMRKPPLPWYMMKISAFPIY